MSRFFTTFALGIFLLCPMLLYGAETSGEEPQPLPAPPTEEGALHTLRIAAGVILLIVLLVWLFTRKDTSDDLEE